MLGTLDAWLTTHLSQQTSVLYCRLSDFKCFKLHNSAFVSKRGIVPQKKKDFHHIGKKKKKKNDARPFALLSRENELSLAWLELASF